MKIKNLADYPQQLGDGRMIGAVGTKEDRREYDLPELTKEDKRRVKRESLAVIEEVKEEEQTAQKTEPEKIAEAKKGGNK